VRSPGENNNVNVNGLTVNVYFLSMISLIKSTIETLYRNSDRDAKTKFDFL